ncbi:MAG: pentapeptide repeat-containing protein [Cyanobacteria bacterium P01_A01_bin.114]
MADQEHLEILQAGVTAWNRWRVRNPTLRPNLRGADLQGLSLSGINFHNTYLGKANLSRAYLFEADFQSANLRTANLSRCCLIGANLHNAYLANANLRQAYLSYTDLSNAYLHNANLRQTDLKEAILTAAVLTQANLQEADLSHAADLEIAQIKSAQSLSQAILDDGLRRLLPEPALSIVVPSASSPVQTVSRKPHPGSSLAEPSVCTSPFRYSSSIDP